MLSKLKNARNAMLVTLKAPETPDDDFIRIRTYDPEIGTKGNFLINAETLASWFINSPTLPFMDTDCGNIVRVDRVNKNQWRFRIWWTHNGYYDQDSRFHREGMSADIREFTLTTREMTDIFVPGLVVRKAERREEYDLSPTAPLLVTQSAHRTIASLNRSERNALKKFLRMAFRWYNSEGVKLSADGGKDFFFREYGECGLCGGVILHRGEMNGYKNVRYEMHT